MPDTVNPYDDEVVDPYAGDDVKNPHDETGDEKTPDETPAGPPAEKPARPTKKAPAKRAKRK